MLDTDFIRNVDFYGESVIIRICSVASALLGKLQGTSKVNISEDDAASAGLCKGEGTVSANSRGCLALKVRTVLISK